MNSKVLFSLILGFILCLSQGINYSQLAPYFPTDAGDKKGVSTTLIGLITGAFDLSDFIAAFVLASFMKAENQKTVFWVGGLIAGVSSLLTGVMEWSVGGPPFVAVCVFLRLAMGIGASMVWSTGVLIMAPLIPSMDDTITSWTESSIGLGIAFGPPIGSALYACGGFSIPFFTLGTIQVVIALMSWICIVNPSLSAEKKVNIRFDKQRISEKDPGFSYFGYITTGFVLCVSVPLVMQSMVFGFLDVAIGPYLEEKFDIGGKVSGYYFLPFAIVYALCLIGLAPLIERGYGGKIYLTSIILSVFGLVMLCIPGIFPNLENSYWLMFWLTVQGMTISGSFVPASQIFETLAFDIGFRDSQNVKLIAASWLNCLFATGRKFGPLFSGGFFLDLYGFYNSCLLQAGIILISLLFAVVAVWKRNLLSSERLSARHYQDYELLSNLPEDGSSEKHINPI